MKKFHEAKTEELLQSESFLEFKSSVINYINDFVNSYIKNSTKIKEYLLEIDEEKNSLRSKELRAIHKDNSKTKILVIPTNEELEIAKQVYGLLN